MKTAKQNKKIEAAHNIGRLLIERNSRKNAVKNTQTSLETAIAAIESGDEFTAGLYAQHALNLLKIALSKPTI